jgi:hypothetical protein
MIKAEEVSDYQQCIYPYKFDRIEVAGSFFTGPAPGAYLRADFERPTEPVSFSLLGEWHCEYPGGPSLFALADMAANILGVGGFYGLGRARRIN